jgi:YVTN family beta-propeller protein
MRRGRFETARCCAIVLALIAAEAASAKSFILMVGRRDRHRDRADWPCWAGRGTGAAEDRCGDAGRPVRRCDGGDDTLAVSATRATGTVFVIDLLTNNVATQVTGVGIDPYGVTVVEDAD